MTGLERPDAPVSGWVIQALLVAAALPSEACALDVVDCKVHPLEERISTPDRREAGTLSLVMVPGVAAVGIEIDAPSVRLKNATHVIATQVDNPDFHDALEVARSRFALAAAVFALASDDLTWEPAFTLHGGHPVGRQGEWMAAPFSSKVTGIPVGAISAEGTQRIASLLTLLKTDAPTSQLLDLWYSAMDYGRRAFDLVDHEHILIRYVKVFERVAMAMAGELRDAGDKVAEAAAIQAQLDRLQVILESAKTLESKGNIAIQVAREIDRIRLNTIGKQLDAAAEALGLDPETKAAGARAWTARSTKAGHPPDVPSEVTLDEEIDAREAARGYLVAYLVWRSKISAPQPDSA